MSADKFSETDGVTIQLMEWLEEEVVGRCLEVTIYLTISNGYNNAMSQKLSLKGGPKQTITTDTMERNGEKEKTNKQKQKTDGKKKEIKVIDVFLDKYSKIAS